MNLPRLILLLALAFAPLVTTSITGCKATTTLEAGGAYSDSVLAKTDQAILDASRAMAAFIDWHRANSVFLAKWPEIGAAAVRIAAQRDRWIRDAYEARDAYAAAAKAYRAGAVGAPSRARLDGALAALNQVVVEIVAYQQAHKP